MILRAYCVYDVKALSYHVPFFAATDGAAVRSFQDLANDPNTTVGRHPADFVLYCVGAFDGSSGGLGGYTPLIHVADAAALVNLQRDLFQPAPVEASAANGKA